MTARLAVISMLLFASQAFAQDGAAPMQDRGDTRWAVYTACTLVFVAIVVYLISTHKRLRRATDDLEHVERRVNALSD